MLRSVGWALVLGGLGYAVAWVVLPIDVASTVAIFIMLTGVAAGAIAYFLWHTRSDRPTT
jgi:hypothetical protein